MTSSTFDRLLAQQRGALPDNTGSYYELEKGDLKYDGVKNVNDAIDSQIQDFNQRTTEAINESIRYHKQKDKNLKDLVGLIGVASKFKKWEESRKVAEAEFDRYYTNTFDDFTGKPESTDEELKYIQEQNNLMSQSRIETKNTLDLTKKYSADGTLSPLESITGVSESEVQRENISGIEAGNQYSEGFQTYYQQEVHVKKRLVNPRTGESMPYAMSYMEVLESDDREIKEFLPWLYRDIYSDYHAANQDLVDRMGDRHFRFKVFPGINKVGGEIHQKLLNRQLSKSIESAEEKINENILTEFNSHKTTEEQIQFIFGENGFIASREIGLDGTKDNPKAWRELTEWMVWAVEKGAVDADVAQAFIDSVDIPKRGGKEGETTDLDGLKNPNAIAFKTNVGWAIGQAKAKSDRYDRTVEQDTVKDLVQGKITQMEKDLPKDAVLTDTQINNGRQEVIQAAKEQGIYLLPTDPLLARFNTLESNLTRNEANARYTLNSQIEQGDELSQDLFKHIPRTGHPSRNRGDYEEFGRELGVLGLTREEQALRDRNLEYELTKGDAAILDPKRKDSYQGINMMNKARSLYDDWFDIYLADATKDKDLSPEEFKKAKENAKRQALNEVKKEALKKKQNDDGYFAGGLSPLPDEETSELRSTAAVIQKIKTQGVNSLTYDLYYPGEKEAIQEYMEWKKDPKGRAPLSYWRTFSSHIRREVPGMPNAASIAEDRIAATEHLRVKGEENEPLPPQESANDEDIKDGNQKEDDAKYCQAALKPDTLDTMLNDLAVEDRDFDTIYSPGLATPNGYQEENFNNELPHGKPLSQTTVEKVALAAGENPNLRFGAYDIPADIVYDMYDKGIIDKDEIFDEDLQKEIVLRKIINIANQRGSNKTWDNTYRKNNWITRQEKAEFTRIMTAMTGQEITDPYSDITLLSPECAKALIGSAMGQQ